MKKDENTQKAITVEFGASWGEPHILALFIDRYAEGGGLALCALDATGPASEDYSELWDVLSVNLPDARE